MRILSKIFIATLFTVTIVACKETKTEDNSSTNAIIEKVKEVELELENVTNTLEKEAEDLDKSLDALDEI